MNAMRQDPKSPSSMNAVAKHPARRAPAVNRLLDVARQARRQHRRVFEGPAKDVVRLPETAETELIHAVSRSVSRSVQQIVPFSCYRTDDDFSHRVWRGVAAAEDRGVAVQRLYVIPPGGDPAGAVDAQIAADRAAGAESRRLRLGSRLKLGTSRETSPWALAADLPLSELWLLDGSTVVRKELSDHGPPVWVVSARDSDVRWAGRVWQLWDTPAVANSRSEGQPDLMEPLVESARMIHTMAPMLCTRDHVDRVSCSWYHGVWQYLRLFDMVSSPSWHSSFYERWLATSLAGEGRRRVLITGAADYSLLAYVIAAARVSGKLGAGLLEAHVMDLCATPLNACRWYADRFDLGVRLHEADILGDAASLLRRVRGDGPSGEFDLIATDAFLTRFSRDDVGRVLDNWRALLRPGGHVVTTVRLHPREARRRDDTISGVPQELVRYTLRLRERALGWRGIIGIDLDALVAEANEYIKRITSTDIGDLDDIVGLIRRHGFQIVPGDSGVETADVDGELAPTVYARMVLTTA
jgi:SAM-dependent methyltransferase